MASKVLFEEVKASFASGNADLNKFRRYYSAIRGKETTLTDDQIIMMVADFMEDEEPSIWVDKMVSLERK